MNERREAARMLSCDFAGLSDKVQAWDASIRAPALASCQLEVDSGTCVSDAGG